MSNLEPLVIMLSAPISSEAPHGLFAASLVVVWAIDIAGPIRSPRTPASPNTATIRVMTHLPPPRMRMLILACDLLMLTLSNPIVKRRHPSTVEPPALRVGVGWRRPQADVECDRQRPGGRRSAL